MGTATPFFALEGVHVAVDERTLLHPLDLILPPGRVIGLIGHNGSGKSTLLKVLAGQLTPTGGQVQMDGKALSGWSSRAFARQVAYLPQTPPATGGLSVRELVSLGRYPWHGALGRFTAQDRQKVDEAIALTEIGPMADRLVDTLSGGERQRAWLATLVAQDAPCLLLDEPTSALDIAHQVEVLALVKRLSHERGIGVIIVLHDVNMAARFCDELLALHTGRMIARGKPVDLVEPATLEAIYGVPMEILRRANGELVAMPL